MKSISKGGFSSVYEVFNSEKEIFALKVVNLDDENNVKLVMTIYLKYKIQ